MIENKRLLQALACEPVDRTPVWIMRQAGRYLPEYRAVRKRVGGFMDLCQNPELACEVTMQPLRRFDLDAAILFSDILTIPDAMGLGLYFSEGEGPRFSYPVRTEAAVKQLPIPDPELSLGYVMDAVRLIKKNLNGSVPLLGFSGSPWTLATYMVEGGSSKTFQTIKKMLYAAPELLHEMLHKLTHSVKMYLAAQIAAGVDAVMIFDTWGGVLSTPAYHEFSLAYMEKIIASIPAHVPTIIFTKNGHLWLESIAKTGCNCIGLDWLINFDDARSRIGDHIALQGNMDPNILYSTPEAIEKEVIRILDLAAGKPGHIFNLGHGILPDIPPDNVTVLIEAIQKHCAAASCKD